MKRCISCGKSYRLSGSGKRQKYCPQCAKRGVMPLCGLPGSNPLNTLAAKQGSEKGMGAAVRDRIEAQKDMGSPITFLTPDGAMGRVWLAYDKHGKPKVGDERHWRHTVTGVAHADKMRQPTYCLPRATARDEDSAGYKPDFDVVLSGDDFPIGTYPDGYPVMPKCLQRKPLRLVVNNKPPNTSKEAAA
jgi:hypothetical protein